MKGYIATYMPCKQVTCNTWIQFPIITCYLLWADKFKWFFIFFKHKIRYISWAIKLTTLCVSTKTRKSVQCDKNVFKFNFLLSRVQLMCQSETVHAIMSTIIHNSLGNMRIREKNSCVPMSTGSVPFKTTFKLTLRLAILL